VAQIAVMRVAVIEGEPAAAAAIARRLGSSGLEVRAAHDAERGLQLAMNPEIDLVVLDLMLPGRSGMRILCELSSRRPGLPVIVLGGRDTLAERLQTLRTGAVDHLARPFALAELDARVHAQLRTARLSVQTSLQVGAVTLDFVGRRARHAGGEIHLSNREFDLLTHLARNPGQVLGRPQLQRAVWGYLHDPGTNVVDVYIGYVRRKLATASGPLLTITTVRSRGYRLEHAAPTRERGPAATAPAAHGSARHPRRGESRVTRAY
jgi:DNA-binding response OmpR family regulator